MALLTLNVHAARPSVPLVDVIDVPIVAGNNQTLTDAQVKRAIRIAGATRDWKVTDGESGELIATLLIRAHTAVVTITYDQTHYSILYKDSKALGYDVRDDVQYIHPAYHHWLKNFSKDIKIQLDNL